MIPATVQPLAGLWKPTHLKALYYGAGSVEKHLLSALPTRTSKAFIVTGNSLATKTPLIKHVERLLGAQHAGTFSQIKQHSPVHQLDEILSQILPDNNVDTVLSIGGGSPIDSSKALSHRFNERKGRYLCHIAIPTTLSAAECTMSAAMTDSTGLKSSISNENVAPSTILYDATFAAGTPADLFMPTGFRALDHAVELLYHPTATEIPCHILALNAASSLFIYMPRYRQNVRDLDVITSLQLAAFSSLGFLGQNVHGPLGLSHTLGYALGSPYGIPHGVTSTLTLGHVVKLKAQEPEAATQLARLLPFLGESRSGDDRKDAEIVGDMILRLVQDLGLATNLESYGVGRDQASLIVERATKKTSGPLFDKVLALVHGLY